jgi:hypothetical protein
MSQSIPTKAMDFDAQDTRTRARDYLALYNLYYYTFISIIIVTTTIIQNQIINIIIIKM